MKARRTLTLGTGTALFGGCLSVLASASAAGAFVTSLVMGFAVALLALGLLIRHWDQAEVREATRHVPAARTAVFSAFDDARWAEGALVHDVPAALVG